MVILPKLTRALPGERRSLLRHAVKNSEEGLEKEEIGMMAKKVTMGLFLGAMALGMFSAGLTAMADDAVTIRYGIWDSNQEPTLRAIADKFEEENPDIKVEIELTPYKEYFTALETGATGGSAPDVFWMNAPHVTEYARGGMLTDLSPLIEGSETVAKEDFPESLINLYTVDGTWYGMPKGFDTIAVWYNKEIFDNAGVDYPTDDWTWDDFVSIAEKLTDPEQGIYGAAVQLDEQAGWYNTIGSFGGYVISDDKKTSGFDDPKTKAGIQCWADLIEKGVSPTYAQLSDTSSQNMFESGKLAMQWNGSWSVSEYLGIDEIKDKIDVVALPTVDGNRSCVIHGLGNVIFSQTQHPEEAWKFVEFLGGKEAMTMQAEAAIDISARTETTSIWVESHPEYNLQVYMDAAQYAYPYPASANTSAWSSPMYDEVYAAFNGDKTVDEACDELAQIMNDALAAE